MRTHSQAEPVRSPVVVGLFGLDGALPGAAGLLSRTVRLEPRATIVLPARGASIEGLPELVFEDHIALDAGVVCGLPSGATGVVDGDTLQVRPGTRMPGDALAMSLADALGRHAVVVLVDATLTSAEALRYAKEQGVLVLALAGAETEPDPEGSSLAVDGLLDLLARHLDAHGPTVTQVLDQVIEHIRRHTGNDFGEYRRSTLVRRIQRRMAALGVERADAYLRLVQAGAEAETLVRELLVSVTRFFRDPEALSSLSEHLQDPGTPELRAWVPGCATGEEAYTVAMLLLERRGSQRQPVVVFATDLDDAALAVARAGRYPPSIAEDVGPERLARYFEWDRTEWVVGRELRDCCVFSHHNLVQDPPFSRLALVSCRNVLIYLESPLQARLLPVFHFALLQSGVLLLGSAETAEQRPDLFEPIDRAHRVYRRRAMPPGMTIAPPPRSLGRSVVPAPRPVALGASSAAPRAIERALLERYAPPGAVVTDRGDVVYLCGPPSPLLESPRGSPPFDIVGLVRAPLRHPLRMALAEAWRGGGSVECAPVGVGVGEEDVDVVVVVAPLPELVGPPLYLVSLHTVGVPRAPATPVPVAAPCEALERELLATRQHWQATQQALERSNEELRASNEELQALNEELHTSREELESINEELQSVNAELRQKIDQLDAANGDLQNLFDATDVGAVLLDGAGRIRRFSPAASALFPVIPSDVGRPLAELSARVADLQFGAWVASVRATGEPVSVAVRREPDGKRFAVRVVAYRTVTGAADGVVVTFVDVTALDDAERAAEERASELSQVLEALPAAVYFTHHPDAREVTGNALAARLLQASPSAPLPLFDVDAPFQLLANGVPRSPSDLAIARAARGETLRDVEVEVRWSDGSSHFLLGNAEPLRNSEGTVRGAVAAFIDVTARREAEAALAASEERYRTLAGTAKDFITRFDADLKYLYANPAVLARMGRSLPELIGTRSDRVQWLARLEEVLRTGTPMRFDFDGQDGTWYDVQLSPEVVDGRVVSVVSVARDVTTERRAVSALRLSEARHAATFAVASFGLLIAEFPSGVILAVNPALERMLGRPATDIVGHTVLESGIIRPESRDLVRAALVGGPTHRGLEVDLVTAQGEHRQVHVNLDLTAVEGSVLVVTSLEDVTDQRRAEAERERLQETLGHARKMEAIGTLAGGVAHDFNNILAGLQGGLAILEVAVGDDTARIEVRELQDLVQRGAGLTRQLLGFARGGRYDVKALSLSEVVGRTASMFRQTRRDLLVSIDIPAGVPPVLMDRSQLEQVLLNLFVNAGHAMPQGGRITIVAAAAESGGARSFVQLRVSDTGSGMDEVTRQRIFEPFFTTKAPGEGTGLGLASVYGIVTNHGGSVEVESAPGRGTTFHLRLPAADVAVPDPERTATTGLARGHGTVLIVDDEAPVRRVFSRVLEHAGYRVLTAELGAVGVELVRRHGDAIDLVLLDLTMPELSGSATFDAMRAVRPDLRVVVCSGYGPDGQARELLARGCVAFLQKPFTAPELTALLRSLLPGPEAN